LLDGYCEQRFRRGDRPEHISAAYRRLLESVVDTAALDHPALDLALTVVRARAWGRGAERLRMLASLAGAAALNLLRGDATQWFFERVVFHTARPGEAVHPMLAELRGRLASGTVPVYMQPVLDVPGAGPGGYLDGGLADYHVNQPLCCADGVIVMFSHQARVVPGWFDKALGWRESPASCADLLVVYPSPEFIAKLPGGRVPTRDDFWTFEHTPDVRVRQWREVAERSRELGETFLDDLRNGAIAERAVGF
jgi:hypothetical protein